MMKLVFSSQEGLSIWPIISLIIFFLFFIIMIWWTMTVNKDFIRKMKKKPLEDETTDYT